MFVKDDGKTSQLKYDKAFFSHRKGGRKRTSDAITYESYYLNLPFSFVIYVVTVEYLTSGANTKPRRRGGKFSGRRP